MAVQNRKAARTDLAQRITTAVTALQAFYSYAPKDVSGQSPVGWLESLSLPAPRAAEENRFAFAVVFVVDRADAGAAEDLLDDIAYQFQTMAEGINGLVITQPSATDIIEGDNQTGQWRTEVFQVEYLYEGA